MLVQEAGWAPGPVWMDVENLTLTGVRFLDCPTCKELLYRLICPGPSSVYMKCDISLHRSLGKKNKKKEIKKEQKKGRGNLKYIGRNRNVLMYC
jgi:hypothetical protein